MSRENAAREGDDTYQWYFRAAQRGDPYAQFNLAQLYLRGAGVAFELMMEIRNKLLDAYQEILKMQP